jgi:hypothetical protein
LELSVFKCEGADGRYFHAIITLIAFWFRKSFVFKDSLKFRGATENYFIGRKSMV